MAHSAHTASTTEIRTALAARLRERLAELQDAVATRLKANVKANAGSASID